MEQMDELSNIEWFEMSLKLIAGLVLFIYAVTLLSKGLKAMSGNEVKNTLAKFTTNRFTAVLTGTVATIAAGSSSITIITVIAMVNAGLLTFVQSLGVVLGSNIGTTFSSQIFAFDAEKYAPLVLLMGFVLHNLGTSQTWKNVGLFTFAFGLVFFSLGFIGDTMSPFKDAQIFKSIVKNLENPWTGVLAGAIFTSVIQSSSATMGIVIALASQGMITLPAGVAVMLGAAIGTCTDTLIASIGRSKGAVRTGIFHLLFNSITVVLGVMLIEQIIAFTEWISAGADLERQIAHAHVLFNVAGAMLFIGFTGGIARFLCWLIPSSRQQAEVHA